LILLVVKLHLWHNAVVGEPLRGELGEEFALPERESVDAAQGIAAEPHLAGGLDTHTTRLTKTLIFSILTASDSNICPEPG